MEKELISKVKKNVKIQEIIAHYIPLNKSGKNFKCICPFHTDHEPSMIINPDKQLYKCFVCNGGGDVYNFVMNYENIPFIEAYQKVVEIGGLSDEYLRGLQKRKVYEPYSENEKASHALNEKISRYMEYHVMQNIDGSFEYLSSRGLSEQTVKQFRFGYLPDANKLIEFLKANKYTNEELLKSNFFILNKNNSIYCPFEKRITIPIHDSRNKLVGFGARRFVDEKQKAKYINSTESEIFHKSEVLFNYYQALNEVYKTKEIYLVEGYMDAIMLSDKGIHNVVAVMGTALTEQHIQLLNGIKNIKVHVCFDMDTAGKEATLRAFKLLSKSNLQHDAVWYEQAKDPAELLQKNGSLDTISWFEFFLNYQLERYGDLSCNESAINDLLYEWQKVESPIMRNHYFKMISDKTGLDLSVLKEQVDYIKQKEKIPYQNRNKSKGNDLASLLKNKQRIYSHE